MIRRRADSEMKEFDKQYVANTYARFDLEIVKGKGSLCYDENGKEYIDMASGIAVNTFGFCDEKWQEAVIEQIGTLQHCSNLYYTKPCVDLAELLCGKTEHLKRVFFSNSGAEANECAIKAARKYATDTKGSEYQTIITMNNSFHGRTITTLAATGQESFHIDFQPLTKGFLHVDVDDVEGLEAAVSTNKVAAIMIETIQGEGGVHNLSYDFVKAIEKLCQEQDILLVVDEIQTGNGRTGKYFGYMHYDVKPDIISTAKGLGGGLPIGATLFNEKTKDVLTYGKHGSTFGGNPVSCAGGVSIVSRIDDNLLAEVERKSRYIIEELTNAKGVISVSGKGLMIGIEVEKNASEVINACMENGVLVIAAKTKVRLLPALNIPDELLEKAIAVIKKCCA